MIVWLIYAHAAFQYNNLYALTKIPFASCNRLSTWIPFVWGFFCSRAHWNDGMDRTGGRCRHGRGGSVCTMESSKVKRIFAIEVDADYIPHPKLHIALAKMITLPETNSWHPKMDFLEDYTFPIGKVTFPGLCETSGGQLLWYPFPSFSSTIALFKMAKGCKRRVVGCWLLLVGDKKVRHQVPPLALVLGLLATGPHLWQIWVHYPSNFRSLDSSKSAEST